MNDKKEKNHNPGGLFPGAADLRGKQSVRATFRLTEDCIDAISIVTTHLGIKKKSLFDHLVDDGLALKSIARAIGEKKSGEGKITGRNRIQKTFVISRKSLSLLDIISKDFNAPRDAIVEYLTLRLMPVIGQEKEKHEKRKIFLKKMERHFEEGRKLLMEACENLGPDDPVCGKFEAVMANYANGCDYVESYVERGNAIENFEPEADFTGKNKK